MYSLAAYLKNKTRFQRRRCCTSTPPQKNQLCRTRAQGPLFAQGSDFVVCRCDPGGAVSHCCALVVPSAALPFAVPRPTQPPESGNRHHSSELYSLSYTCDALHSENGFRNPSDSPIAVSGGMRLINCEQLRQSRQKDAFGAGCFVQREFYKNVALGLVNRLMDTDNGGNPWRRQGASSQQKPRSCVRHPGAVRKAEVEWDLWSYLKLSGWEADWQGLWKSRYSSFLTKIFEKIPGHVLPAVCNGLNKEIILMSSSLYKIGKSAICGYITLL